MAAVVLKSFAIARPSPVSSPSSSPRMAMVSSPWVGVSPGLLVERRRPRARFEVECSGRSEAPDTATGVPDVTTKTWQSSVLESDIPVLVDFWAPWCGPCRIILPLIEELSQQYAGKLKCVKLNTDESPEIPTQYGIRSIPTIIIFKNGEKKDSIIGAVPKASLTASIEKFI